MLREGPRYWANQGLPLALAGCQEGGGGAGEAGQLIGSVTVIPVFLFTWGMGETGNVG